MQMHGADTPLDGEDEKDRLNREVSEVLSEVRVALPGVQVLFAFLLALPFQSRWSEITAVQRDVYFGSLCLTLLASMLMITPSAWHRANFRAYDKRRLIVLASRCTLAGLALLGLAMCGVLYVIAEELFPRGAALSVTMLAAACIAAGWWLIPFRDRRRHRTIVQESDD